jgi:very-short-patch-repair endonuclease
VLEREFLKVLKQLGLPLPDTNVKVGKYRVDCRWIDLKVTIELVSFKYHNSKYSWDKDHDREREARMRGDEWRQFTYDDVFKDQTYMLGELRKLLRER